MKFFTELTIEAPDWMQKACRVSLLTILFDALLMDGKVTLREEEQHESEVVAKILLLYFLMNKLHEHLAVYIKREQESDQNPSATAPSQSTL